MLNLVTPRTPTQVSLRQQVELREVTVWCCPTAGCPSYFGSDSAGDLTKIFSGPKTENKAELLEKTGSSHTKSRADCPICMIAGVRVQRVPIVVRVPVPSAVVEPVPLPRW